MKTKLIFLKSAVLCLGLGTGLILANKLLAQSLLPTFLADKSLAANSNSKSKEKNSGSQNEDKKMAEIYEYKAKALDGSEIDFKKFQGDVLLIVNTASACGYTPQYAGLEELHKKFADKGLKVLGFPCNQFGKQEPGDSHEIATFCQRNYGVDFQMFDKIDVNGTEAHPLYRYLTGANNGGAQPIKWNFTKFLIDRNGKIVKRFESDTKPEDIAADIEKQL